MTFKEVLAQCMPFAEDDDPRRLARLGELFRLFDQTRILTLIREGPWGCVDVNHFLDQYLRPRLDRPSRGVLFPGAPVLITRNDHGRQLFNGDVGLTLRSAGDGLRVVFPSNALDAGSTSGEYTFERIDSAAGTSAASAASRMAKSFSS